MRILATRPAKWITQVQSDVLFGRHILSAFLKSLVFGSRKNNRKNIPPETLLQIRPHRVGIPTQNHGDDKLVSMSMYSCVNPACSGLFAPT